MRLAAIDIGSNSIKVVVVDAARSDSFDVLASDRETVRLGQETLVDRHISEAAMQRAVACLKRFRSLAEAHYAEQIVAIATAFLREADNAAAFIRVIERETGLRVDVLSGLEEARLIGLAAYHGCTEKGMTSLNIDIGGGSTEISIFRDNEPMMLHSIGMGAVGLTDRIITSDPPGENELEQLRTAIRFSFESCGNELLQRQRWDYTTATSGTAMTIGAALNHTEPTTSTTITLLQLERLNATLARLTIAERSSIVGIPPQRADIIVAGALILEEMMRLLRVKSLRTCDWSLREGVIIDRLRAWERSGN